MLPFFTNPYPDELLYSAIARYHFYSGNLDCKDTLEELFGSRFVIPSVEIGSYFSVLAERLGPRYSVESLLAHHTIYPYYASFLSKERQQEIMQDVLKDGQALYTRLGIVAGSVCRKDGLYYCAECAEADNVQFGEPYMHREHQLQGINYCSHHEVPLRQYPIKSDSRIEYIRFEMKHMNLTSIYDADPYKGMAVAIAKQAYQLLQIPLHQFSREVASLRYRGLLREYNLITASNRVRQKELYQAMQSHYGKITFEHPEVGQSKKSTEPKKYTLHTKKNLNGQQDELLLDEKIEGTTDDFDVIEMDNQKHEYINLPKITKVRKGSNKKREFEDENTKKQFINDEGKRSTADVGGNQVTRGLEQQALLDIHIDGELGEFIKVMRVVQDFQEVQSINIIKGSLKEYSSSKRFVYLNDGVTERKYVIAEIKLVMGKEVSVIEVEREDKAISTLICFTNNIECKKAIFNIVLNVLVKNSGVWNKGEIQFNVGVKYLTLRHGKKDARHRANLIQQKANNF